MTRHINTHEENIVSDKQQTTDQSLEAQRTLLEKRLPVDFREVRCLGDMELLEVGPRLIRLRTHISDNALNPRGFAHGGWLFTLCDASSGALVFSRGLDCVTQNASINYLHGGWPGDTVDIEVRALHWGRTTVVNQVTLTNQDDRPLAVATMTMYVMH